MKLPLKSALLAGAAAIALGAMAPSNARAQSLFDGPYVGGWVGYHQFHPHPNNTFHDLFGSCAVGEPTCTQTFSGNEGTGFQGGGFLGYGYSIQHFYVGVEGEVSGSDASTGTMPGTSTIFGFAFPEGSARVKAGLGYGGAARLGYIPLPNWLLYGKVGWGFQDFSVSSATLFGAGGHSAVNSTQTLNGVRYGAGTELALPGFMGITSILPLVRLEWDHTDYGKKTFSSNSQASEPQFFSLHPNDDSIRVGLVLKFGPSPP